MNESSTNPAEHLPTTGAGILSHADYGTPLKKWLRNPTIPNIQSSHRNVAQLVTSSSSSAAQSGAVGDISDATRSTPPVSGEASSMAGTLAAFEPILRIIDQKMRKCPWSKIQQPLEILECCKSEADEVEAEGKLVAECQRSGSVSAAQHAAEDLEEELGDMLFSTLLFARVCERTYGKGTVSLEGALARVADKVGHRCPYVFDDRYATSDPERASELWGLVKKEQSRAKKEKRQREETE